MHRATVKKYLVVFLLSPPQKKSWLLSQRLYVIHFQNRGGRRGGKQNTHTHKKEPLTLSAEMLWCSFEMPRAFQMEKYQESHLLLFILLHSVRNVGVLQLYFTAVFSKLRDKKCKENETK